MNESEWRDLPWAKPIRVLYRDRNQVTREAVFISSQLRPIEGSFTGTIALQANSNSTHLKVACDASDIISAQPYEGTQSGMREINRLIHAEGLEGLPFPLHPDDELQHEEVLAGSPSPPINETSEFRANRRVRITKPDGSTIEASIVRLVNPNLVEVQLAPNDFHAMLSVSDMQWRWL